MDIIAMYIFVHINPSVTYICSYMHTVNMYMHLWKILVTVKVMFSYGCVSMQLHCILKLHALIFYILNIAINHAAFICTGGL